MNPSINNGGSGSKLDLTAMVKLLAALFIGIVAVVLPPLGIPLSLAGVIWFRRILNADRSLGLFGLIVCSTGALVGLVMLLVVWPRAITQISTDFARGLGRSFSGP